MEKFGVVNTKDIQQSNLLDLEELIKQCRPKLKEEVASLTKDYSSTYVVVSTAKSLDPFTTEMLVTYSGLLESMHEYLVLPEEGIKHMDVAHAIDVVNYHGFYYTKGLADSVEKLYYSAELGSFVLKLAGIDQEWQFIYI